MYDTTRVYCAEGARSISKVCYAFSQAFHNAITHRCEKFGMSLGRHARHANNFHCREKTSRSSAITAYPADHFIDTNNFFV
jgi:hypothetical protein